MVAINLKKYLKTHKFNRPSIEDLAKDIKADPNFPKGKHTIAYYIKYLETQKANHDVYDACRNAFKAAIEENHE